MGGLSQHLHSMSVGDEVRLEGPFGRGLELEPGHFLAICGGTGVIPLLDLVYELLLELHRRATSPSSPSRLPVPFRLTMYLSLNTPQDLESLSLIPTVYLLGKQL